MEDWPIERKRNLLRQNKVYQSMSTSHVNTRRPAIAQSYGPASASGLLPRLVPQLTGDSSPSIMKRFSIAGWGAESSEGKRSSAELKARPESPVAQKQPDPEPLQPQAAGGLWSSWWASGAEKSSTQSKRASKEIEQSAIFYVDGLKSLKADMKLVKHLISLRVHLSTAKVGWIQEFTEDRHGIEALASLLGSLVGKDGKRKALTEVESSVLLEIVKCFRVLLNTEVQSTHSQCLFV